MRQIPFSLFFNLFHRGTFWKSVHSQIMLCSRVRFGWFLQEVGRQLWAACKNFLCKTVIHVFSCTTISVLCLLIKYWYHIKWEKHLDCLVKPERIHFSATNRHFSVLQCLQKVSLCLTIKHWGSRSGREKGELNMFTIIKYLRSSQRRPIQPSGQEQVLGRWHTPPFWHCSQHTA